MSARAVRLTKVDIDNALANAHLEIVYQPILSLPERTLLRHEAFVRWDHPGLGNLPPGAFISFFEAQGRIGELTRYVLGQALRGMTNSADGDEPSGLSINLSISDLCDPDLPGDILTLLAETGFPPSLLTLECPPFEVDVPSREQLAHFARLRDIGCALSVEVRARATESLKALSPFPFTEIKTGGAGVLRQARQGRGGPGMAALAELIAFARERDVRIIAVGVEGEDAVDALETLGFDGAQGNALGRPGALMSADEAADSDATDCVAEEDAAPTETGDGPKGDTNISPTDEPLDLSDAEVTNNSAAKARKARLIAAKQAALRRFHAAREATKSAMAKDAARKNAAQERAAAIQAANAARQLQDRLEQNFGAARYATVAEADTANDAVCANDRGICVAGGFAGGIRLDGYAATGTDGDAGVSTAGAVASPLKPTLAPTPPPKPSSISEILNALPTEIFIRQQADSELVSAVLDAPTPTAATAADALDAIVATSPVVEETPEAEAAADAKADLAPPYARHTGYPDWMPRALTRKYRITHFWPRSWKQDRAA